MYPAGASTFVDVEGLSERLDGQSRPGHFRGVATVVAKLMIAAEADLAFFGQKDAAQVAVLRRMVVDLRLGTTIVVCPTAREADGLALSSRNAYLSPEERKQALVLNRAIRRVEALVADGERSGLIFDRRSAWRVWRRAGSPRRLHRAGGLGDAVARAHCRTWDAVRCCGVGGKHATDRQHNRRLNDYPACSSSAQDDVGCW